MSDICMIRWHQSIACLEAAQKQSFNGAFRNQVSSRPSNYASGIGERIPEGMVLFPIIVGWNFSISQLFAERGIFTTCRRSCTCLFAIWRAGWMAASQIDASHSIKKQNLFRHRTAI